MVFTLPNAAFTVGRSPWTADDALVVPAPVRFSPRGGRHDAARIEQSYATILGEGNQPARSEVECIG